MLGLPATQPVCSALTIAPSSQALASDLPNLGPLRTMHGTPISFSCSRARPVSLGSRGQGLWKWGPVMHL